MYKLKMRLAVLLFLACSLGLQAQEPHWTGTWAAAVEWAGSNDLPETKMSGKTLREVIHTTISGTRLRMKLSNEFSRQPVDVRSVYIALAGDSSEIVPHTAVCLRFRGRKSIRIAPGKAVYSDPFAFSLPKLAFLSVTVLYGKEVPEHLTSHRGSRTTSYIAGNRVTSGSKFHILEKLDHWYTIAQLEVETPPAVHAVAVLGNSITDGRGSTTNRQNRWPDRMAESLGGRYGVLNLGIGGNCVVQGGLSQPALKRFDRDILGQHGIDKLIIFEGTNDIGISKAHYEQVADTLIASYKVLIARARKRGLKVYGATITPFKGSNWYSFFHEAIRETVNQWIRTSGSFDGVLDFDRLVRDEKEPQRLKQEYSADWLHLNPKGYEVMGRYAGKMIQEQERKQ